MLAMQFSKSSALPADEPEGKPSPKVRRAFFYPVSRGRAGSFTTKQRVRPPGFILRRSLRLPPEGGDASTSLWRKLGNLITK